MGRSGGSRGSGDGGGGSSGKRVSYDRERGGTRPIVSTWF